MLNSLFFIYVILFISSQIVSLTCASQQFNYEIERRILDRLSYYLREPVRTNAILNSYLQNGGFENNLTAPDRDDFLTLAYSLGQPLLYYGLEDGLFAGYFNGGMYREPGNGGYDIGDKKMHKHLKSCVNKQTGKPEYCLLKPGDNYIKWINDGALQPCTSATTNSEAQHDCSRKNQTHGGENRKQEACRHQESERQQQEQTWCRQYMVETVQANTSDIGAATTVSTNNRNTTLGYVPMTNFCYDIRGQFTQDVGAVFPSAENTRNGNCYFGDGATIVNRKLEGDYAYCGGSERICANTFSGGYQSGNYDPRYRPWYITTKLAQSPNWSPPYPFYDNLGLGVTYSHPMYTTQEGKKVFAGVFGVDYRFDDIAAFLKESYGNTSTSVVVYEDAEPHYIIGTSTGNDATMNFVSSDLTQPCPLDGGNSIECTTRRIPVAHLSGGDDPIIDDVLVRAFEVHKRNGYSKELFSVSASSDENTISAGIYLSQSTLYEQSGANLKWRVIIVQPGQRSTADAITKDSLTLFPMVSLVGGLGLFVCILCIVLFFWNREEAAVINADWRFTCAFISGCALFNISTFTLLGPNTDATCMLRMWSFHSCFVIALSPLFIKIWRMKQLVGQSSIKRVTISNKRAAMYTLPVILSQIVILSFITAFDPPRQTEMIENTNNVIYQRIVCSCETNVPFITEIIFEAGFVLVGCILAFKTRALNEKFGESKQLIFAMYNIALVGVLILIVVNLAQISPNGMKLLQAIGVFWGTVFSSAVFVLPRIMQVREDSKREQGRKSMNVVHVSGIGNYKNTTNEIKLARYSYESVLFSSVDSNRQNSSEQQKVDLPNFFDEDREESNPPFRPIDKDEEISLEFSAVKLNSDEFCLQNTKSLGDFIKRTNDDKELCKQVGRTNRNIFSNAGARRG